MGFIAICRALYSYEPRSAEELELKAGELLYIVEQEGEDGWWKAQKQAMGDEDDEPEGLIPNNYVETAKPLHTARALFDYSRQTDEEVSFSEHATLEVFDMTDSDWILVSVNGEYGFAPANYIEIVDDIEQDEQPPVKPPRVPQATYDHVAPPAEPSPAPSDPSPAAALANVLGGRTPAVPQSDRTIPIQSQVEQSEEEGPAPELPRRPPSQSVSIAIPTAPAPKESNHAEPPGIISSPPHNRVMHQEHEFESPVKSPGGFHLYNISEMVSVMGRRKKMPTTLGLNIATGTIMLSPEKVRDGPTQEWTADKLAHYSIEGKHVFLELVRPSKSLDLHAGTKDTAQEIVSALGEIAGAQKAEGFKEVIAAAASGGGLQKKGVVLYDFMAQGDDEVTVAVGDEILIIDDEKSEEWWNIRRLKNGSEGVMPSSYIEVTGIVSAEPANRTGINAGKSTVDQNRLEEERLAQAAVKLGRSRDADQGRSSKEVQLPERGSSLTEDESGKVERKEKSKSRADNKARSKPDPRKTRTWTDYSGSFKVDAQFIGIADGKIHLHKANGVKIAVPVAKMSAEDIEYVEKVTHELIEDHIPVADLIKLKRKSQAPDLSNGRTGASVTPTTPTGKASDYEWFDFFLAAGIGPHQCERYAQAMVKDSMDESVLPDITLDTLRAIGLKEGDALKVMKHLDQKFSRSRNGTAEGPQGGIFSGPGGALHNNTRRGRPETSRQTSDVVDANAFEQGEKSPTTSPEPAVSSTSKAPAANGFDDDAWNVKQPTPSAAPTTSPNHQKPLPRIETASKPLSENLQALSLLDKPLEPTPAVIARPASQPQVPQISQVSTPVPTNSPPPQQPQATGANPAFFTQIGQQSQALPRQRPQPPPQALSGTSLLPPPPRPLSAPQNPQQSQFGLAPLQPQLTGLPLSARPAGPGQSLDELTDQRMQQQFIQTQPTGYGYSPYMPGMAPQPTGFMPQQQPYLNGNTFGSPFADPRVQSQPTGYALQPGPAPGSLNSVLPPALQPQRTGYQPPAPQLLSNGYVQPQPTGYGQPQPPVTSFGQIPQQTGYNSIQLPPVPPMPRFSPAPLTPQKTGPAPNIKFGVKAAPPLVAQPTGMRANLAHATPQNPFGM